MKIALIIKGAVIHGITKYRAVILAAFLAAAASFCLWQAHFLFDDRICEGVMLQNISLGQMRREEAQKTIEEWWQKQPEMTIALAEGNTFFNLRPQKDIDLRVDASAIAEAAFKIGREESVKTRLVAIYRTKKEGRQIPLIINYNQSKLENILHKLQAVKDKPARNVAISLLTREITPAEWGRRLDVGLLRSRIIEHLYGLKNAVVTLPIVPVAPQLTEADLDKTGLRELMATYATTFNAGDTNRTSNIKLAAKKINGCLLWPEEIFSFNNTVGPREKEHGFKEAMEIVGGEFVPGIGGGVCQVSSTLYNAVLLAGLNVVERTNHSRPLRYVPPGRDATVAYGSIDFKFVNNNLLPVMILAETEGNRLHVGILGRQFFREHSEAVTFEIITTDEKTISPPVLEKEDAALPPGISVVDSDGSPGCEVGAVRITHDAQGRVIKREALSFDKYLPDNKIVRIGKIIR